MHELCCDSVKTELHNIASWWSANSIDADNGGFVGEIDFYGRVVNRANKGIILNSRILWFFSELSIFSPTSEYLSNADRAFQYLLNNFDDKEYGGAVWELDYEGKLINGKKQVYAQCFCIYAYLAYYQLTKNELALEKAFEYFHLIENNARDYALGGYMDAMSQKWTVIDDFRLSDKDLNAPKTMNTHLHILEAYTALHQTSPNDTTKEALSHVIEIFQQHIIDHEKKHLKLFFDRAWNDQSISYSYGHDIEASWLLHEAIQVLGNKSLEGSLQPSIINLAETCLLEGLGEMGQLCDDFNIKKQTRSEESIWWVQTEALVGFLSAYILTKESKYITACEKIWYFICQQHLDKEAGEWHWLAAETKNGKENNSHYKVGFWKAPYHNGRAMMKTAQLLEQIN